MIRSKTEIASLGLDDDGTVRGRLLSLAPNPLETDDAQQWPRYKRFAIFGPGREWEIIDATPGTPSSTIVVAGDQSDFVIEGDEVNITRVIVSELFTSTAYTVTAVVAAYNSGHAQYETTITVTGTIASLELDRGDFLNTKTIRPASYQVYAISSFTTGANGTVTITDPQNVLVSGDMLCAADMFMCEDLVEISGSEGAINDGYYECRLDRTDNGSTITVHLDGYLNSVSGGAKGNLTLHLPAPRRVIGTGRAVLSWYRTSLRAGSIVHCRAIDTRNRWFEVIAADIGPSDFVEPDP